MADTAKGKGPHRVMLTRLLALAAHALAEVTFTNAASCSLHIDNWSYHACALTYVVGHILPRQRPGLNLMICGKSQ